MTTSTLSYSAADVRPISDQRAGFWIRLAAAIMDAFIVAVPALIMDFAVDNIVGQLLGALVGLAYYVYLEGPGGNGQTIGKRATGIRVISSVTGGPISYGAATGRYFARILSTIPLFLGYFWMLWDPQKQTWHDKLAGSYVVPAS